MIITKEVKIKINPQNIKHYINLGYVCNPRDEIIIKTEHLSKGSNYKIRVKCDKCGKEKNLIYLKYFENINRGGYYSCSNKCSVEKQENYFLEKYGVKIIFQNENIKNLSKQTKLKKYGDENYNNINKNIKTNLEKYGCENVSSSQIIKNKKKETNLKNWGVENVFQNEDIKEKSKQTCLEKYGVKSYTQTDEYKNYIKSLNIDYNVIQEKMKITCLKKYNCEYSAQNIDIFNKTQMIQLKMKYYKDIRYQGTYELDFLIFCDNNNILNELTKIKSLKYFYENKNKIYHPDFFIQKLNLIIEIKSDYYYNLYLEKNLCKQNSCIKQNYDFMFIINKNYDNFIEKVKAIIK